MGIFRKKQVVLTIAESEAVTPQQSNELKTTLSFPEEWDITDQEKYVYMFKHQQLDPLQPNQISIQGIEKIEFEEGFLIIAFLRNTLDRPFSLGDINLLVLGEDDQELARKKFETDQIGELPPLSCIPWRFLFGNEDKSVEELPEEGWTIAFDLSTNGHSLELDQTWDEQLSAEKKEQLKQIVAGLPQLNPNEVNFTGLTAALTQDGGLAVSVLIRNGNDSSIQLEQLPLIVEDATKEIVCRGNFTLDNFSVQANCTKPWTFIFTPNLLEKKNPDLTRWSVHPPQES